MKIIKIRNLPEIPASHEDPENPGSLKKVLITFRDFMKDAHIQMINWARLKKGKCFNPHYHEDMDEIFIILKGSVMLTTDGKKNKLNIEEAAVIRSGEVHKMENITKQDVIYLAIGVTKEGKGKTVNV